MLVFINFYFIKVIKPSRNKIKHDIMCKITLQRILQSTIYKNILLLTGNAELWHVVNRKGIVRNKYLEDLRENLLI